MTEPIPYLFSDSFILRTPGWPFVPEISKSDFDQLTSHAGFLEAVYLASPVLYEECLKLREGLIADPKEKQKIQASVAKYYQRMFSRCTPFGLFSGCSTANWSNSETKMILDSQKKERHTRLDMHFLCGLSQQLAKLPAVKNRLLYYTNNSIYKTGGELRYVEYKYVSGRRVHQISEVLASGYLEEILHHARNGITIAQMTALLLKETVSPEESMEFIEELLEAQVLTNEMEPAITGAEFIYQIIQTLQKINHPPDQEITNTIDTLLQIEEQIRAIDSNGTNPVEAYKKIINLIDTLGVAYEENKLFQCDLVQYASQAQLNQKHQKELLGCLQLLNGLYTNDENDNLKLFRNRFLERYEDKEMPLLEVLDAETGIGYLEMSGKNISPLLEGIAVAPTANGRQQITWEKAQQWLFGLLNKANAAQLYEIEIREEDILDFKPDWKNLPASLSVIFRLINDERILIENFSGSSAANLLGRFAHGDKKIENLVQKITRAEQQINPNIIFAEIIHLPESRVGNILLHPVFRDYEIPYLAKSSLPESTQIALEDLYVSVQSNDIRLFSKKLNKEIIPRLSSAHNFSFNALPVYQFLCDMQSQNIRNGFSFFWGSISSGFRFLPRVVYKNVVLSEAAWQINKKEIGEFLKSSQETETGLAHQLKMPRYLVLADGDNELLVDRENAVSMMAFSDAVKNRDRIVLKEFSGYHNLPVCNEKNEFYNNQCIASLIKTIETHPGKNVSLQEPPGIQRSFVPGSEWFYAKIYCGPKSADKILEEFIGPLKEQLAEKEIIDSWFFIRYADPHFHIRLRFHVKNIQNIGTLMQMAGTVFDLLQKQSLSWNIKLDTYNRELERYAGQLCEPSESLFRADSDLVLEFLKETEGDEREQLRWLWGMKNIDFLLDCFLYTLEQKEQLLDQCRSAYGKEFNFEKFTLQSINKKYAAQRIQIESVLGAGMQETAAPIIPVAMFETNKLRLNEIAAGMLTHASGNKIPLDPLMISFMHMSLNRLFLSESRLQEAILYEFLYKWYVSLKHRKNNILTR